MAKLKDFVKNGDTSTGPLTVTSTSIAHRINAGLSILPATLPWSSSDTSKFSSQAAELVTKDEFLDELENKIGSPQKNESEDEFVSRAKAQMRVMLKSKLK